MTLISILCPSTAKRELVRKWDGNFLRKILELQIHHEDDTSKGRFLMAWGLNKFVSVVDFRTKQKRFNFHIVIINGDISSCHLSTLGQLSPDKIDFRSELCFFLFLG